MTVTSWLSQWFTGVKQPAIAPSTARVYRSALECYVLPQLGPRRLDSLTRLDIAAWVEELRAAGVSQTLLERSYGLLCEALEEAVTDRRMLYNPAPRNRRPRARGGDAPPARPAPVVLTEADLDLRLTLLRQQRSWNAADWLLIHTMALVGLRTGEALGLRWADLDDAGRLSVSGHVDRTTRARVSRLKTASSRRVLPLPSGLLALLRQHRADQREQQLAAGIIAEAQRNDLIFPAHDGRPISANGLLSRWRTAQRRMGLPPALLHQLRHVALTRLEAAGISEVVRKRIAGHALSTHERYINVTEAELRAALETAERRMLRAATG